MTADLTGWAVAAPAPDVWRVGLVAAARDPRGRVLPGSVWVRRGAGPERRIGLKPDQVVTDYALLPPLPPLRVPIVAVASHELGEPSLALYDGATGEQVRQLTGHVERIRDLAFSADGRLLASAAEDQTVCVWSLVDLEKTLGRRGRIAGVSVTERDGGLVVAAAEPDAARADGALQERDLIQGLVEGGQLHPLASVADFYNAVSAARPGQAVTVRRVRDRQGPRDVTLRVAQGIDERKPLWSLFVTRDDAGPARGWIGWSPLGPYESSGPDVEPLLGWHFNTGDPATPTRFARADQYRRFFHAGILKELLDHGGPAPPAAPPIPPRPKMSLTIEPQGDVDGQGLVLARRPPASLTLTILGKDMSADQVEAVRWLVDGSAPRELPQVAERAWSGDFSGVRWTRGVHRVRAVLRTREETPQEFSEERLVRFQPPPPEVEVKTPRGPLVVDRPGFTFEAAVRPALGRVRASVIHRTDDRVLVREEQQGDGPLEIRQPLVLKPGVNTIELIAVNEAGDRPEFMVACLKPEARQRLHLLIVEVGRQDAKDLRDRALRALHATLVDGSSVVFRAPAFAEGRIYGPLTDDVRATELYFQLDRIRRAIDPRLEAPDLLNYVVVIYYQGHECVDDGRPALRLRTGRGRTGCDVIGVDDLAGFFAGTRGAQVFLQELLPYLEWAPSQRFSAFIEAPIRFINPTLVDNASGFCDLNAGFKYALVASPDQFLTFQFRTYIPTGDGDRGLGTEHVSLEPALLVFQRLTDRLFFHGELRDWIPVGGSNFAGNVIRYGAGLSYNVVQTSWVRVAPVTEFVGWSVLGGMKLDPALGPVEAGGDTIVNAKIGLRIGLGDYGQAGGGSAQNDRHSVYIGYGRALTGDHWYSDMLRLEYRFYY